MYHCHVRFYLTGQNCRAFEIIKEMLPFEHFTHEFVESIEPDKELASGADVIFANLQDMDAAETSQVLCSGKAEGAELILLMDQSRFALLADRLSEIKDIWTLPVEEDEVRFRFLRWQQTYEREKDFWQTSQFFESTK